MRKCHAASVATVLTLSATFAVLIPPAPASAGGPVKITAAYYDPYIGPDPDTNAGRNLEYIVIRNGGSRSIALTGFVLHDVPRTGSTNRFVFPKFTLRPGKSVRVHTGSGSNSSTDLYWGKSVYVWGDDADTATLQNKAGSNVSVCSWGTASTSPHYC
jgi:hypothetical protein